MIHIPYETNGKLMVLGVPILRHFRVLKPETFDSALLITNRKKQQEMGQKLK